MLLGGSIFYTEEILQKKVNLHKRKTFCQEQEKSVELRET